MKKYLSFSYIKSNILIIIVTATSFVLRFVNLGYSDYQGDEIKALYLPAEGESFFTYVLDQRKGPVQFIITYLLKFLNPEYDNQFLMRLPFAIAGFLAVIFFFKFMEIHFGKKVAFYSSMFFATNGFLVAFSRIVQYQSFVILFMVLALYLLSMAVADEKYRVKGIYFGLICWAVSILSHYDGVFIAPFAFYLIYKWFKISDLPKKVKIKTFILAGVLSALLLAAFYIPFVKSISDSTLDYWEGRVTGSVSEKISSSRYLFSVYQPIYVVHIYTILFLLGVIFISLGITSTYILRIRRLPDLVRSFFTHTTELMTMIQKERLKIFSLFVWFGAAVLFFEWYVYISGTHIYNYLIPSFTILAFGLVALESTTFKVFEMQLVRVFNFLGIFVIFLFISAQSYAVFVDNFREYPWEEENFLIWKFPKPNPIFHLSMFGFPYFRDWEGISNFIKAYPDVSAYSTNERASISRHYVKLTKNADKAGFYVHVKDPQSFTGEILSEKALYWAQIYEPVYTLTRYGRDMVRVYLMEPGNIAEITRKGF